VQLRVVLAQARREGLNFDAAWLLAMGSRRERGRVRFQHATNDRQFARSTLEAQREEWRSAYLREPSAMSHALRVLSELLLEDATEAVSAVMVDGRPESRMARFPQPFVTDGAARSPSRDECRERAAA
jgi:hypothetical protein